MSLRSCYVHWVLTTTVPRLCNDNATFLPRCRTQRYVVNTSYRFLARLLHVLTASVSRSTSLVKYWIQVLPSSFMFQLRYEHKSGTSSATCSASRTSRSIWCTGYTCLFFHGLFLNPSGGIKTYRTNENAEHSGIVFIRSGRTQWVNANLRVVRSEWS